MGHNSYFYNINGSSLIYLISWWRTHIREKGHRQWKHRFSSPLKFSKSREWISICVLHIMCPESHQNQNSFYQRKLFARRRWKIPLVKHNKHLTRLLTRRLVELCSAECIFVLSPRIKNLESHTTKKKERRS